MLVFTSNFAANSSISCITMSEVKNEIKKEKNKLINSSQFHLSAKEHVSLQNECLQFVLQDHNYGAPPPQTPPPQPVSPNTFNRPTDGDRTLCGIVQEKSQIINQGPSPTIIDDDTASVISSEADREVEPEGEETETAPEGEGDDEDSTTRCVCDFEHDDGYMICCDQCFVWQHVDCMGIDRSNIPDEYLCEICRPRRVDRTRARALQMRKREELLNSDTSSDSSSSCSTVTSSTKKKNHKFSQSRSSIPLQKSDEHFQTRQINNDRRNNKKQSKDTVSHHVTLVSNMPTSSTTVTTTAVTMATTQITKQQKIIKRKTKKSTNLEDNKNDNVQNSLGVNIAPVKEWIEKYEEAITNHYSPELRNKISNIKVNGALQELKQYNLDPAMAKKYRLITQNNKFLIATTSLPANTPVLELRGKYMLSTQHRATYATQNRQYLQRPGPFIFFYQLPYDSIEICVDTRTYGNDARFIRRSCKPNADIKHCIEKGTLHLYIVTSLSIEKDEEITICHDQYDFLTTTNSNFSSIPFSCACNNTKNCQYKNLNSSGDDKKENDFFSENNDKPEKRRRGRKNVNEKKSDIPLITSTSMLKHSEVILPSEIINPNTALSTKKNIACSRIQEVVNFTDYSKIDTNHDSANCNTNTSNSSMIIHKTTKDEPLSKFLQSQLFPKVTYASNKTSTSSVESIIIDEKKDKKKLTREERKMEAIMKAFERLEKAEQKKQEVQARNAQRKEPGSIHSDNDDSLNQQTNKSKQINVDKISRRKKRKGRTRSTSISQPQIIHQTRLHSNESDIITSGDENNCLQLSSKIEKKSLNFETSKAITSVDASLLLSLAHSNDSEKILTKQHQHESPIQQQSPIQPTPVKSPNDDSGTNSSSQSSTPSTPISAACLLVAAAVEPLAPGFKFPKTKKLLMNEWLKEEQSPLTSDSQIFESVCANDSESSREYYSQNCSTKSLATLVQAAHSISNICDISSQCIKQEITVNPTVNTICATSSGSAKKRWLRQAISEECDSPISNRPESPPSEMVAPPKKRRIARESISSDNYTPPTTPTMISQDYLSSHKSFINGDEINKLLLSPTICNIESQNICESSETKDEIKSMSEDEIPAVHKKTNFHSKSEYNKAICKLGISRSIKFDTNNDLYDALKEEQTNIDQVNEYRSYKRIENKFTEMTNKHENNVEIHNLTTLTSVDESVTESKQNLEVQLEFNKNTQAFNKTLPKKKNVFVDDETVLLELLIKKNYKNSCFDKYDVDAQIKITGDNGNDKEKKIKVKLEKNENEDKIQELMENSLEDFDTDSKKDNSESIKVIKDSSFIKSKSKTTIKGTVVNSESLKNFEIFESVRKPLKLDEKLKKKKQLTKTLTENESINNKSKNLIGVKNEKIYNGKQSPESNKFTDLTPEESILQLNSMELPSESISIEPLKTFSSILPLSERIRKRTDSYTTEKSKFGIDNSNKSLNLEFIHYDENINENEMFSTAIKEILETKIEIEDNQMHKTTPKTVNTMIFDDKIDKSNYLTKSVVTGDSVTPIDQIDNKLVSVVKKEETISSEHKKLKDPRTVVPNKLIIPSPQKMDVLPPVKRKLSISEYRKRKQQSLDTPPEPDILEKQVNNKNLSQGRSDSTSSGTSSLSSDEENLIKTTHLELDDFSVQLVCDTLEVDEKKGGDDGTIIGWSAAPTLVERQRENLTERLKREFGLFLNDDEEEKTRKQGLSSENSIRSSDSMEIIAKNVNNPVSGAVQLPPEPYIPPPGIALCHYAQYSPKQSETSIIQYSNYLQSQTAPVYSTLPIKELSDLSTSIVKKSQQQMHSQLSTTPHQLSISQAPPGSNPYPPPQFIQSSLLPLPTPVPPPSASISISHYSSPNIQYQNLASIHQAPSQSVQKNFCSHSTSKS